MQLALVVIPIIELQSTEWECGFDEAVKLHWLSLSGKQLAALPESFGQLVLLARVAPWRESVCSDARELWSALSRAHPSAVSLFSAPTPSEPAFGALRPQHSVDSRASQKEGTRDGDQHNNTTATALPFCQFNASCGKPTLLHSGLDKGRFELLGTCLELLSHRLRPGDDSDSDATRLNWVCASDRFVNQLISFHW